MSQSSPLGPAGGLLWTPPCVCGWKKTIAGTTMPLNLGPSTISATEWRVQPISIPFPFKPTKFALTTSAIANLIDQQEWPGDDIDIRNYAAAYLPLSDTDATAIYQSSDLAGGSCRYQRNGAFDCDDFAYTCKGSAALYNHDRGNNCLYAVGIIAGNGNHGSAGHATIVYINESGQFKIFEPHNGTKQLGRNRRYNPYQVMF
jgi:hypothetical protein